MAEETTFCVVHPDRETSLRCNKCGRLMCADCAVLTPVGYRCRECVRQHENKFFTATQSDYVKTAAVCAVLTGIAGAVISAVGGFLLLMIFIAIPVGGAVGETALRITGRRRGRYSAQIAAAACVAGGLLGAMLRIILLVGLPPLDLLLSVVLRDLSLLIFVGVVAFIVFGRFRMRI
jgi:hypothetical protein